MMPTCKKRSSAGFVKNGAVAGKQRHRYKGCSFREGDGRINRGAENATGPTKRFKAVADRHKNRRKRFGLRFNLMAGICNYEL